MQKFYLSHLNYSGRGKRSRMLDARQQMSREAMTLIFERAWEDIAQGRDSDFVSGNNDADAVLLLQWVGRTFEHYPHLEHMLRAWGGNAFGQRHRQHRQHRRSAPDTVLVAALGGQRGTRRSAPCGWIGRTPCCSNCVCIRAVGGRQPRRWLDICNGNTRTCAWAEGDLWGQDPGCHLSDEEIGVPPVTTILCVMH